jgi:hypothetical protein
MSGEAVPTGAKMIVGTPSHGNAVCPTPALHVLKREQHAVRFAFFDAVDERGQFIFLLTGLASARNVKPSRSQDSFNFALYSA